MVAGTLGQERQMPSRRYASRWTYPTSEALVHVQHSEGSPRSGCAEEQRGSFSLERGREEGRKCWQLVWSVAIV